jgi:uncharacterized protein (DUF305 family)
MPGSDGRTGLVSPGPLASAPRWARLSLGVLAAVVLLAAVFLGGVFYDRLNVPGDDSVEAGFARDMTTQHAQAVEMALIAYPKTSRSDVSTQAYKIATGQEYQIGIMSDWLQQWHLEPTGSRPAMAWMPNGTKELSADGLMPGMATPAEMDQLRKATGKQVDVLFCQLMIRHHLGGIHMIDGLLARSSNGQVRSMAQKMKTVQSAEVATLQELLDGLNKSP